MSRFYTFAYTVGFRPWERAGRAGADQLRSLLASSENGGPSHGVALDIGCGTGTHTIELASRGWEAVGVDNQPKAVRLAREQAAAEQSAATFRQADVTALDAAGLPENVKLFLDIGCFHDLSPEGRRAMAEGVTALAAPGATVLLLAFQPGKRGPLPRGADRDELTATFAGWSLVDTVAAVTDGMPGPLKNAAPTWYRLQRA
ncbi:MAG TPA: class I SAM-dependent methyltransferase [Gaiellaceae bacterium]|nr:class I SAM-dependent methyltransferase [Gaiellaceae bacterium]